MTEATSRSRRRGSVCAALVVPLLVLAALGFPGPAAATPTATFKLRAIPIPGYPGTGDILGAGTEVEVEVAISGTEYGGFPSPLTGINLYGPSGVKVTPTGFATCEPSALEASGAAGCPKRSIAGPVGVGYGDVSFGGDTVPEKVSIQGFFVPAGGLIFYVEGTTPASFQYLEKAQWVQASPPYGPEVVVEVPLVETVPGANDASVTSFNVKVGAAYRKGNKTVSYITQPKRCPRGGFPVKLELKFLSGETVTDAYAVPCPKHRG